MVRADGRSSVPALAAGPWFRAHPQVAGAVAGLLFAGVLVLRLVMPSPTDAISLLYVFPIGLVALSRGRLDGLVAGFVAVALLVIWVLVHDVELSAVGWTSRVLPLLLVGPVLGDASDRLDRAAAAHEAHQIALQRQREAVEINDTLVQGMSAAKWSIEAGRTESGLQILEETVQLGHQLVSKLIRESEGEVGRPRQDSNLRPRD